MKKGRKDRQEGSRSDSIVGIGDLLTCWLLFTSLPTTGMAAPGWHGIRTGRVCHTGGIPSHIGIRMCAQFHPLVLYSTLYSMLTILSDGNGSRCGVCECVACMPLGAGALATSFAVFYLCLALKYRQA